MIRSRRSAIIAFSYGMEDLKRKRQIKDGYFLDRLLGIIPLFKEAFSWNQSSLQSISVSISP
ncbi:hypothetical protein, partial [uncultured Allobaculum sp.]|uniref:hypothetical protein n=1 Tax=uncultured Allobaculum sp. TaxID=1187017 RepID=UPI002591F10A